MSLRNSEREATLERSIEADDICDSLNFAGPGTASGDSAFSVLDVSMFARQHLITLCCCLMAALVAACDVALSGQTTPRVGVASTLLAPVQSRPFEGRWRPANGQAEMIAGSLTVDAIEDDRGRTTFAFAHGVTIWAQPALLPFGDADVKSLIRQSQAALGLGPDEFPEFYEVTEERVALSAPQGGLCGGLRTRILAIALAEQDPEVEPAAGASLRVAAYHTKKSEFADGQASAPVKSIAAMPSKSQPRRMDLQSLSTCYNFDFDSLTGVTANDAAY